ncbi:putative late blight resistance protein R1A-3 [Capsicum annuum]|uniref:putative late blight resistance protein homolog R1A-3 n=1 Tax=Capsicum annuum TaxID=4072 RepID=UPI001FB0CE70|nr:putative late blight resistance protein homolog R1A-3 [Capsicum annuum]
MAYTGVNYSLNHLVRLLSTPGLTSSKESQIPMLKLELGFLRTFLWWTAKHCRENGNLEALLLQIEVVARNAVSHIQPILLKSVEDRAKELDQRSAEVLHHVQLLKPEIEKAYIKVAKSSPHVPDALMVVEFMNSLIDNLKDLLRYRDPSTFSELRPFVTKLRFLRNLLSFVATRCIDQEKLKDLTNHTEGIAIEAACIPFMCAFDPKDGKSTISIKDKLTELTRKIKPSTPDIRRIYMGVLGALSRLTTETDISDPDLASFIDTLQDCLVDLQDNQQIWMDSLKVNFEVLHHELTFLSSFAKDPPNQFIESDKSESDDPKADPIQVLLGKIRDWSSTSDAHSFKDYTESLTFKGQFTHIQDLAVKVGCTIFFFFDFNELEEHKLVEAETTLVDLIKKIKLLKSEIGVPIPLTLPEVNIIRIDYLGFIRNFRELLDQQAGPVNCLKRRALGIADELEYLSSFLKNCGENLATQLMTAAYRGEYVIESLLLRDGTVFNHSLSLIDAVGEMKRIRREVMAFNQKMRYVTEPKVVNLTMPSRDMINVAKQEELVGFTDERHRLIDELTRGSSQLSVIAIVGKPGVGKTTLAKRFYNDPGVSNHFDICAFLTVSRVYDNRELLLEILRDITGHNDTVDGRIFSDLPEMLVERLHGKRFLIVMDDVWDAEAWNVLSASLPKDDSTGSRILLTTRSDDVAQYTAAGFQLHNIHHLRPLGEEDSWILLEKKIFQQESCPPELKGLAKQLSKKTKGLPFAIILVAGILANAEKTAEHWTEVQKSLDQTKIGGNDQDLSSIIGMSYQGLPDCLRHCFLYFGAFPQDDEILTSKLIRLWIAEGLIQQTEGKSLEDVAVDYLMLLIGRGLIMAEQKSSKDRVKSCRVRDLISEFCLAKAKQENVYRLMDGYGEVSTVDGFDHRGADSNIPVSVTCDHRRLLISSNWWANTSLEVSGPLVRSLVVTGRRSDFPRSHVSSLYHNFKLLRVLDLGSVNVGNDFPVGLENMTLLKYLEVRGEVTSVPSSIGSLQRLETFVTIGLRGEVALPDAIWNLRNLRHLRIDSCASFGAPAYRQEISGKLLSNLRTMSTPILSYSKDSEEILRRLRRLEKLKCICLFQERLLPRLDLLPQLVSLKLFGDGPALFPDFHWRELKFPSSLRRLTLSGCRLPWNKISIIGRQLHNLKVLKLQNNAIEGSHWVMKVGDFPRLNLLKLDTLDLEVWSVKRSFDSFFRGPFPSLERLELQKCKKLKELPAELKKCKKLKEIKVKWCNPFLQHSASRIMEKLSSQQDT